MTEYYKLKPNFPSSYSGECGYYLSHSLSLVKGVNVSGCKHADTPSVNKKKQNKKN